jgi:hypothetical protein
MVTTNAVALPIFDGCLIRRCQSFASSNHRSFEVTLYMDDYGVNQALAGLGVVSLANLR